MSGNNPLETAVDAYVAIYNDGPDGFAVGGHSRRSAANVYRFTENATVTNMKRARWIARTFHDWDIASEAELNNRRMTGSIA